MNDSDGTITDHPREHRSSDGDQVNKENPEWRHLALGDAELLLDVQHGLAELLRRVKAKAGPGAYPSCGCAEDWQPPEQVKRYENALGLVGWPGDFSGPELSAEDKRNLEQLGSSEELVDSVFAEAKHREEARAEERRDLDDARHRIIEGLGRVGTGGATLREVSSLVSDLEFMARIFARIECAT